MQVLAGDGEELGGGLEAQDTDTAALCGKRDCFLVRGDLDLRHCAFLWIVKV